MPEQDATLRKIAWKEVFPWLSLFRVFSVTLTGQVLLLAFLGTMLVPIGWRCSEFLFVSKARDKDATADEFSGGFISKVGYLRSWPGARVKSADDRAGDEVMQQFGSSNSGTRSPWQSWLGGSWLTDVVRPISMPIWEAIGPQDFLRRRAYFVFGSLWMLAVWGLLAGMICRIAVVRLAQEERLTLGETFEFSRRRWHSHGGAPLFPLGGIIIVSLMIALFSLLLRTGTWWGVVLSVFWIPVLIAGCLMAAVKIGLSFGWPLMWPAVAAEETGDVFEATSRSFSYTFQRPLHYLWYALVAIFIGSLAMLVAGMFAAFAKELSGSAALSGGGANFMELLALNEEGKRSFSGWMINFGNEMVDALVYAFSVGFFWCSVSAIYLLLRRDVDLTNTDEVFLEDEAARYRLPALEDAGKEELVAEQIAVVPLEVEPASDTGDGQESATDDSADEPEASETEAEQSPGNEPHGDSDPDQSDQDDQKP